MEVTATARYMRIAPRKARLVGAMVIGMPVKDALTVLEFTPRAAAREVAKGVKSAAANATNNFNQDEDTLVVKSIVVNEGPTLKRGQARARGMFFQILKRTSHIVAVVDTVELAEPRRRAAGATAVAKPAAPRGGAAKASTTAAGAKPKRKATAEATDTAEKASAKPAKAEKGAADKGADDKRAAEKGGADKAKVEAAAEEQRAVEAEVEAEETGTEKEA
jgi:large subunit ribosomal protein L22